VENEDKTAKDYVPTTTVSGEWKSTTANEYVPTTATIIIPRSWKMKTYQKNGNVAAENEYVPIDLHKMTIVITK
jgi:hypothetical protein